MYFRGNNVDISLQCPPASNSDLGQPLNRVFSLSDRNQRHTRDLPQLLSQSPIVRSNQVAAVLRDGGDDAVVGVRARVRALQSLESLVLRKA